ncbi:hypothetical protein [Riemerella anatipestifer]|uniref:hypothetical protein n=1 Tax=Riemerella anatipestifer TaxID=34085 RepID=UPI00129D67D2|nr:hypothetical protein [Riemerella anatipestifer]MDY3520581.1 hypothetical protein [Riemerella anatipestifer]MDY3532366.1 hypothetical protein [Riemerella anatipestifer]MDY3535079.1 hypothetical protein [Riemerella anatipestifer]MRM82647.1 hypothetical protein [Riemerella anatipestifer]
MWNTESVDFSIIKNDSKKVVKDRYMDIYPIFLNFFKSRELDRETIILGISLVYSWMPTIPKIDLQNIDKAVDIIKKENLNAIDLEELSKCFNNSIVGTSKLLHFIYPNKYPIWDSNVCKYFIGGKSFTYRVNKVDNYLKYFDFCNNLVKNNEKEIAEIQQCFTSKFGVEISKMRTLELIFFQIGKSKKLS